MWTYTNYSELYHHGILGQKWGIRRYQNPDGSLTEAGRARYREKELRRDERVAIRREKIEKKEREKEESRIFTRKQKKILAVGAIAVASAISIYNRKKGRSVREYERTVDKFKKEIGMNSLSDAGLKNKINRIKMEQEIIGLQFGKGKETTDRGRSFLSGLFKEETKKDVANDVIKKVATTALAGAFLYGLKAAASGSASRKELGEAIFNGGPKKK